MKDGERAFRYSSCFLTWLLSKSQTMAVMVVLWPFSLKPRRATFFTSLTNSPSAVITEEGGGEGVV